MAYHSMFCFFQKETMSSDCNERDLCEGGEADGDEESDSSDVSFTEQILQKTSAVITTIHLSLNNIENAHSYFYMLIGYQSLGLMKHLFTKCTFSCSCQSTKSGYLAVCFGNVPSTWQVYCLP